MLVAVTGSSGYVGKAFVSYAKRIGWEVHQLGRSVQNGTNCSHWQLGDALPDACGQADCIVHLASATLVERHSTANSMRRDVEGTKALLDSVRRLRVPGKRTRFVFVSSQSARADAGNSYGKSKWLIEQLLNGEDEVIVRPGLVYGDESRSVAGMLEQLARLPLVPVVNTDANIQPIHVTELAECLTRIASLETSFQNVFCLGAIKPLTFQEALIATRRRLRKAPPTMLALPIGFVRIAAQIVDRIAKVSPSISERVEGLVMLKPMNTEASLRVLGYALAPFDRPLAHQAVNSPASR